MTSEAEQAFQARVDAITDDLEGAEDRLREIDRAISQISRGINLGLKRSLEGLVFEGKSLGAALRGIAGSIVRSTYNAGISPVTQALSGAIAGRIEGAIQAAIPFADGAGFSQGRVVPFASGGVVSGPTSFPMRGGTGVMGEAGPEAIMPLMRGADGKLGVRSGGGGRAVNVTINVSTPDVEGFRRSQSQIAAQVTRALGRAERNR